MASSTAVVVYGSLAANVAVAGSKFAAALTSGSSAMLTEAIHSSTDIINQVLLMLGKHRSEKSPDAQHPFGYGGEAFFWVFLVAIAVAVSGGAVSIAKGVIEIAKPQPIEKPWMNVAVYVLSAFFEGASLVVSVRSIRKQTAGRPIAGLEVGFLRFIKRTKDPSLFETLLEDSAALIGVAIALVGTGLSAGLHWLWADGAASIGVGLVLMGQSFLIARSTRSLIANEAADPLMVEAIRTALADEGVLRPEFQVRTLQLGPNMVIAMAEVRFAEGETAGLPAAQAERLRQRVLSIDETVKHVFFDPR